MHFSVAIGEFKFRIQHVLNRIMTSKIPNFCNMMSLKTRTYVPTFWRSLLPPFSG